VARGDALYAKIHVDILTGERVSQLTPNERDTYIFGYWLPAVKYRQSRMSEAKGGQFNCISTAKRLQKDSRNVVRHRQNLLKLGLLVAHPDNTITVTGVEACHPRIGWKPYDQTFPIRGNDFPHTGHSKRVREEEEGNSVPLGTYIFNTGCSAFSSSEPGKNKTAVDRKSDLGNENQEGEPELHDSRIPTDPKRIAALTWEVEASLNLDDSSEATITHLVSSHPTVEVYKAIAAVRDKQHRVLTEPDENFSKGPLEYFKGVLNKSKSRKAPK
jgi:hypothetical protein